MHALNVYSLCFFYTFFFIGNQVATSLTLKVKQLAKQLPSLKTLLKKISVELWVKKFYFFKYKFTEVKFLYNCFWHKLIVYYTIPANIRLNEDVFRLRLQNDDVFKMSWSRRICSPKPYVFRRRLQDVLVKTNIFALAIRLQDVFKMFWRRLQNFFKTSSRRLQDVLKTSLIHLQDVLQRYLQDVFKTYHQVKLLTC